MGCTEDGPSFSFFDAAIAACSTAAGTATMFFSFDNAMVWELAGPAIDTVIWEVDGVGFTLDVTGMVVDGPALAAAACNSIAVGGGWVAVGSRDVAWLGGRGVDLLSICSGFWGRLSLPPPVVNIVMVCSGSLFETIDGGSGFMFAGGRSFCDDILS